MPFQLHPAADSELDAASDWYEEQHRGLGGLFDSAVRQALRDIAAAPDRWPYWPDLRHTPPIRRFLLPEYPFALPYLVRDEDVVVLAIAHLRRRPDYWLPRARSRP
ncbi:type II toxin-antitoxin system RelE/ParE family toxin [Corallococcus sp. CA049B]|uniref:type II toxin-antitoxin system RelE/ParE family toxin n=1 Tax=Corallococcus sp. CA049B TaxID=2316730 RepID=UPI000EA08F66|nr:type II toxin-antitoxin system RelE/ParE family toxin [Corallococcus sp. CA049B]RKG84189.1 type II toxin-antitoxin system RelE/ParE family toxin [Corallococcus sp. CA049B]